MKWSLHCYVVFSWKEASCELLHCLYRLCSIEIILNEYIDPDQIGPSMISSPANPHMHLVITSWLTQNIRQSTETWRGDGPTFLDFSFCLPLHVVWLFPMFLVGSTRRCLSATSWWTPFKRTTCRCAPKRWSPISRSLWDLLTKRTRFGIRGNSARPPSLKTGRWAINTKLSCRYVTPAWSGNYFGLWLYYNSPADQEADFQRSENPSWMAIYCNKRLLRCLIYSRVHFLTFISTTLSFCGIWKVADDVASPMAIPWTSEYL